MSAHDHPDADRRGLPVRFGDAQSLSQVIIHTLSLSNHCSKYTQWREVFGLWSFFAGSAPQLVNVPQELLQRLQPSINRISIFALNLEYEV